RFGQHRGAGTARQAVNQRDLADDLAFLEELDRQLPAVIRGQEDADDAFDHGIEPVRLVALREQQASSRHGGDTRDLSKAGDVVLIQAIEEARATEPGHDFSDLLPLPSVSDAPWQRVATDSIQIAS